MKSRVKYISNQFVHSMHVCVYLYIYVYVCVCICMYGFPWWLSGKEFTYQCRRHAFNPWVRKIPWRRKWQPTPVFLPGKSHGQRSLAGCSPWDHERVGHNSVSKQQTSSFPKWKGRTFQVAQWLRLCLPNAGGLGSIPGQGTRSCMLQLKTWCNHLSIYFFNWQLHKIQSFYLVSCSFFQIFI